MREVIISDIDQKHLKIIRENVSHFISKCAADYGGPGILLDIAPQMHEGALPYFTQAQIQTLDIDPVAAATYTADICQNNNNIIPDNYFDWIVCTEVLEHLINPFMAVRELNRILKPGGYIFISTPFNFRIHGPLPDLWRFTEHGLRVLLKQFMILKIDEIRTEGRDLMPIHYTIIVQKKINMEADEIE